LPEDVTSIEREALERQSTFGTNVTQTTTTSTSLGHSKPVSDQQQDASASRKDFVKVIGKRLKGGRKGKTEYVLGSRSPRQKTVLGRPFVPSPSFWGP
jgi:hypothetical protein